MPLAVVFDLDGTLVDNMRFHAQAWMQLARSLGVKAEEGFFATRTAGKKNAEILPLLLGRPVSDEELLRLAEEKEALYRELYEPHVAPLAGLVKFLDRLDEAGIRKAIATLAPEENRALVLNTLDLAERFEQVIGGEQVRRGKPAPDIFLKAAAALKVDTQDCLAFEDAVGGVMAACAAGMQVVGVATETGPQALYGAGASYVIRDYRTLPEELEATLFPPERNREPSPL